MNNDELIYNLYLVLCDNNALQTVKGKAKDRDARKEIMGGIYYIASDYPWPVIGITNDLLEIFKNNDFKKPSSKEFKITRSHVNHRRDFFQEIFKEENKEKIKSKDDLRNYFMKKDMCILSEKKTNKKIPDIYKNKDYWVLEGPYKNLFYAQVKGWGHDEKKLKEFYEWPGRKKASSET